MAVDQIYYFTDYIIRLVCSDLMTANRPTRTSKQYLQWGLRALIRSMFNLHSFNHNNRLCSLGFDDGVFQKPMLSHPVTTVFCYMINHGISINTSEVTVHENNQSELCIPTDTLFWLDNFELRVRIFYERNPWFTQYRIMCFAVTFTLEY